MCHVADHEWFVQAGQLALPLDLSAPAAGDREGAADHAQSLCHGGRRLSVKVKIDQRDIEILLVDRSERARDRRAGTDHLASQFFERIDEQDSDQIIVLDNQNPEALELAMIII